MTNHNISAGRCQHSAVKYVTAIIFYNIAYYSDINMSSFRACSLQEGVSDSMNTYVIGDNKTACIHISYVYLYLPKTLGLPGKQ